MAFHFTKLRRLQAAAANADEEAIHDMRVAIRRVRAAFRIARPYFRRKVVRSFQTELRALADELGAARDLDVIISHALAFASRQPPDAPKLDAYLGHLRARRASAQQELLDHFGSRRLARFSDAFEAFLAAPESEDSAGVPRVCDAIPAAIWEQYSLVRAYEAITEPTLETLHALRIDFKRLRYLLEFFKGILGRSAVHLIELTVRAQDHLGLLQDATVASTMLRKYIAEQATLSGTDLAAAAAYLTELQNEIQMRQESFREVFRSITDRSFRRLLARLLSNI